MGVPDLELEIPELLESSFVQVLAGRSMSGASAPLVGTLHSISLDVQPEIGMKVEISEALSTIRATELAFSGFDLVHDGTNTSIPGPFTVKAARVSDIDVVNQMCVLHLQLLRAKR